MPLKEIPPDRELNTEDLVVGLLEDPAFDLTAHLDQKGVKNAERVSTKIINLLSAARYLFGENFHSTGRIPSLLTLRNTCTPL